MKLVPHSRILIIAGLLAGISVANAAEYRVESHVYGGSYANTHTTLTDTSGTVLLDTWGSQWFDSASAYQQTPAAAEFTADFRQFGDAVGATSASWSGFAQTTYGGNHLALSMSGAASTTSLVYSGIDPASGTTVEVSAEPYRYVYGYSKWEELFLITSKRGLTGQAGSFKMHVRLSGELVGDSTYMGYYLQNFDRSNVVSQYESGTTGPFSYDLTGTFNFTYGEALYLQSYLYGNLNDEGSVDVRHSAVVTGIELPDGSAITFLSGADSSAYGALTGGLYGQYGGGGTLPVPEPESYAMLLAGLGLVSLVARRRSKVAA